MKKEASEKKLKENPKGKKYNKRKLNKKIVTVSVLITVFLAVGATFTWYLFTKDNHGDRKEINIMTPYFLYLLNPDDTTSLQFSVGNLHPGETKQIVICVSNKRPADVEDDSIDIARESKFNYDLEFIYTENLPVNYDIYELEKKEYVNEADVPDEGILVEGVSSDTNKVYWTKKKQIIDGTEKTNPLTITRDVTKERLKSVFGEENPPGVINKGKYLLYQYDGQSEPKQMGLEYKDNTYEFDYYLIEITWKDGVMFSDYTKETDLIYVVVNAKQPEPKKQTE